MKRKVFKEEIKQLANLGLMGMMVDPKYGGSGMDTISYVLAMEEISKVDASTSVVMSVNNFSLLGNETLALKSKRKIFGSIGKRGNYWSILLIRA